MPSANEYSAVEVEAPPAKSELEASVDEAPPSHFELEAGNTAEISPEDNKGESKIHGKPFSILEFFGFKNVALSQEDLNAPQLPYWEIFAIFLWFGCRAFGGPVAQIALMKQELVTEKKWISNARFTRVYSVYQILPGPEATELACYFGLLAGGRFGALLGGLGFVLPGFLGKSCS